MWRAAAVTAAALGFRDQLQPTFFLRFDDLALDLAVGVADLGADHPDRQPHWLAPIAPTTPTASPTGSPSIAPTITAPTTPPIDLASSSGSGGDGGGGWVVPVVIIVALAAALGVAFVVVRRKQQQAAASLFSTAADKGGSRLH